MKLKDIQNLPPKDIKPKARKRNPEHNWFVDTWYINPMGYLINYQRGNHAYGFMENGEWKTERVSVEYLTDGEFVEASKEQVLDRLSAEAEKRGLTKGAKYLSITSGAEIEIQFDGEYLLTSDLLALSYVTDISAYPLFLLGKWAKVVSKGEKNPQKTKGQNKAKGEFEGELVSWLVEYHEFTQSDAQGFVETSTNREIIDSEYDPKDPNLFTLTNIRRVAWIMLGKKTKPKIEVGQVYMYPESAYTLTITKITKDKIYFKEEKPDGKGVEVTEWTPQKVIDSIKGGFLILQTQELYKVGDCYKLSNWEDNYYAKITSIKKDEKPNGRVYYEFFDKNDPQGSVATPLNLSKDTFDRWLSTGELIIIDNPENEYANNTQEELKALLTTYTYLAEKGNVEAKQEIVILQKLIK